MSPIRGLTDRVASFPQIGVLRKGGPKPQTGNRPGPDLQYFRFDTDDQRAAEMFHAAYGDKPKEVNVYFAYATPEENFQAWQEEYRASSLVHRCDGETCVLWLDPKTNRYSQEPKRCPGGCKPTGRLFVIVPELQRFAYVVVGTTSINDIIRLTENLEAYYALRGDLRGIPFVLRRTPEMISTPRGENRVRAEKWLLSIEALPEWVALQLQATRQKALGGPASTVPLLTVNAETGEIVDEDDPGPSFEAVPEVVIDPEDEPFDGDGPNIATLIDTLEGDCKKFAEWCRKTHINSNGPCTQPQYGYLQGVINNDITEQDGSHYAVLEVLCGRRVNSKNVPGYDLVSSLLDWLPETKTEKIDGKDVKVENPKHKPEYVQCVRNIYRTIQQARGQLELLPE